MIFIIGTLLGFLMAVGVHGAKSESGVERQNPTNNLNMDFERSRVFFSSPKIIAAQPDSQLQTGQILYQSGQYSAAADVWKAAASEFESQGDRLDQGLILSYLALAYQQLGQFTEAEVVIDQAVMLTQNYPSSSDYFIVAQIINNQGQIQFNQGQFKTALETWKKAEKLYQKLGDSTGEIGTKLNQSRALQALGFYLRARTTLEQVEASLSHQSDSQLKLAGLLNLGNVLRVAGDFTASYKIIEQGLAVAQKLESTGDIQVAWLSLGNLAEAQQQPETALDYYQKAAAKNSPVQLQSQIRQLKLLVQLNHLQEAQDLLSLIQTKLAKLPPSQTTIYAQIELADSLVKLNPQDVTTAAQLLAMAQTQAKQLGNPRAESYALGRLGQVYLQTKQWDEAKRLTEKALRLSEAIQAEEIAYQWQWQMGKLLFKTGDKNGAIASYTEAVNTLQSLRQDLVAINQDVQFSFQEQVEPVYRELVDLLLQPIPGKGEEVSQANLKQARTTIESLQLAELANFFREACLDTQPEAIDRIDPTAAVIYPIILPDSLGDSSNSRLEVILSLPDESLKHYSTNLSQAEVDEAINRMRQSFRRTSFAEERLSIAQEIYSWLVQPAAKDLSRQSIKTLVFVLDGSLRNLPMAALHDGKQYLIEQYRIAIAPSLQLLTTEPLARRQSKALLGGLSEGKPNFSALPGVKQEVKDIDATVSATVLLDQQFTTQALETGVKTQPYSIIHLATHGQFSSKPEDTFILTWDGRLDVQQLNTLLTNRELSNSPPLELLVLSACQTAKGDTRAALGLAGVAVRSGARSTLATLWTVSDESTATFMEQFYKELFTPNITKSEAVRRAQLHLLKQPESSHPYFWAPFILVGNWL
ncbi:MAG: CHAT domain-containing protein [Coleofasciculus sp. D1-CHI-01]|uniref:CHAT domain-containing protein n=1 Tax=Coleofasciculus sp. D1-CHI-01 TaxID=3068482 RepID=UPI003302049F